eukprot:5240454-Pleurochrysis_carterae.AAC.1
MHDCCSFHQSRCFSLVSCPLSFLNVLSYTNNLMTSQGYYFEDSRAGGASALARANALLHISQRAFCA